MVGDFGMTCLAAACIAYGAALGAWASRRRFWWAPFAVSFTLVLMIALARRAPAWEYRQPIYALMKGRREYLILGFNAAFSMFALVGRLRFKRQKAMVWGFTVLLAAYSGVVPFVAPMLVRSRLLGIQTRINEEGVCRQKTEFTCGPAASVTALRQFGISADEGPLAIEMHTSELTGTDPDVLAEALNEKYGLSCQAGYFPTMDDLPKDAVVLAIVKFSFLVNHYVVILKIEGDRVTIADPLEGKVEMTREAFEEKWLHLGVVMRK